MEYAQKAIDLDELDAWAHALMGCLLVLNGKHSQALATSERAIALAPNYADVVAWAGWTFLLSGLVEEGIFTTRRAIRLCPISPAWYLIVLAYGLQQTGQSEEAIALCSHAITREPDYPTPYFLLAVSCSALGRHDEAREAADGFRRVSPHTPHLQEYAKRFPFKDSAVNEKNMEILRKAGLE